MADLISASRERIRYDLTQLTKSYLEIQDVDFTKTHYLAYLLDVLSVLTANTMNFSSIAHHESNLITAQLDESVRNLSAFIAYNPVAAKSAKVDVLFTVNLKDAPIEFRFVLEDGFQVQSSSNIFQLTNKRVVIERDSSSIIRITIETPVGNALLPFILSSDPLLPPTLTFYLPFDQVELVQYEYVVDDSIAPFQFYMIEQPTTKSVTRLDLKVNGTTWTETDSTYLMSNVDKQYVIKTYIDKFVIIFGNGMLGVQPKAGDIVDVSAYLTNGSKGNVIPSSITKKDRIIIDDLSPGGTRKEISFDVTNPTSATGGSDLEENNTIKERAISGLSSLKRLVSALDFKNLKDIANLPYETSISYLKRSDLKINEMNTYGVLLFEDDIVPTTSVNFEVENTLSLITQFTKFPPSGTYENLEWYFPYEIRLDFDHMVAKYYYLLRDSDLSYTVSFSDIAANPIFVSRVNVTSDYVTRQFTLRIEYNKDSLYSLTGILFGLYLTGRNYTVQQNLTPIPINDTSGYCSITFGHELFPSGTVSLTIDVKKAMTIISRYISSSIFKYDLKKFTMSQIVVDAENTTSSLIDVPVWEKSWYDDLTSSQKKIFELATVQKMFDLYDSTTMRMMNSFVNFKMPKTKGIIDNIYRNLPALNVKKLVKDSTEIPSGIAVGDQLAIVGPVISPADIFYRQDGAIALLLSLPGTSVSDWRFDFRSISTLLYDEDTKLGYFYDGHNWYRPQFELPLKIHALLYTKDGNLSYIDKAKTTLLDYFTPKFGIDQAIYRSEIISALQQIDGVTYVKLLSPEIDLYFNYSLDDIDYTELIKYVPEYIFFRDEDITIEVKLG